MVCAGSWQRTLYHSVGPERVEHDEDEPEREEEAGGEILAGGGSSQLCTAEDGELPPEDDEKETQEGGNGIEEDLKIRITLDRGLGSVLPGMRELWSSPQTRLLDH